MSLQTTLRQIEQSSVGGEIPSVALAACARRLVDKNGNSILNADEQLYAFKKRTARFPNAAFKTLPTIGGTVVAAPGPNKIIVPFAIIIDSIIDTIYTNIDASGGANLRIDFGNHFIEDSRLYARVRETDQAFMTGSNRLILSGPFLIGQDTIVELYQISANKPLFVSIENGGVLSGALTGGAATNLLRMTAYYVEHDLTLDT